MNFILEYILPDGPTVDYWWLAYCEDKPQYSGMGKTPEEALGFCILNRCNPDKPNIFWKSPKPNENYAGNDS